MDVAVHRFSFQKRYDVMELINKPVREWIQSIDSVRLRDVSEVKSPFFEPAKQKSKSKLRGSRTDTCAITKRYVSFVLPLFCDDVRWCHYFVRSYQAVLFAFWKKSHSLDPSLAFEPFLRSCKVRIEWIK